MNVLFWVEFVSLGFGLAVTANTINNLRVVVRLSDHANSSPEGLPFVSVLVPARNEERSIGSCLESLALQSYPAFEVIVLDDSSDDCTAAIAREAIKRSSRLTLIAGQPLPDGWYGKAFACAQLAGAARGDLLIFTDADTRHEPTMIRSVVNTMADGADVVTAFPQQEAFGIAERLATFFMLFTVWSFLPAGRVRSDPSPRFVAANGQLLAFTRAAYLRVGGHSAVRRSVLDDVDLARSAKHAGLRVLLADGVGTVRTRMYRSAGEVWRGFSKNALALCGGHLAGAVACAILLMLLYVAPLAVLGGGVLSGSGWTWRYLPALLLVLMCTQSAIVATRTRTPFWQVPLHPLGVIFFVVILANSIRWRLRGYAVWKGRSYPPSSRRYGHGTPPSQPPQRR